jgi:uncharacterized heparinase superfamily protein
LQLAEHYWPNLATRSIVPSEGATLGWPQEFRPIDASLEFGDAAEVAKGRFTFLCEERFLGEPHDWDQLNASRLWRFHLHYFEWAWALAQVSDRSSNPAGFLSLWKSWSSSIQQGHKDAWSPYVASLRVWVMCGVFDSLVKGHDIEEDFVKQISRHAGFLKSHLEFDVGGNHLLKNIKALVGAGQFLGRSDLISSGCRLLEAQLPIQVFLDGGHFERSPSYHCQVLGDLIDIDNLLVNSNQPGVDGLSETIQRMRKWLRLMIGADGELSLHNDAVPAGSRRLAAFDLPHPPSATVTVLAESGYVVVRPDDETQLIMDVGDPCPDDLPAHAHADCLSFELWVGDQRWVTDTGTSTYAPGARREFERSTAAHNTVEVDGMDQTEVWGIFRAARRARGKLLHVADERSVIEVVACHDGYERLSGAPSHQRQWHISPGRVEILDTISGSGTHRLISRLYLTPEATTRCSISGWGGRFSTKPCELAWGFGHLVPGTVCEMDVDDARLPAKLRWVLEW